MSTTSSRVQDSARPLGAGTRRKPRDRWIAHCTAALVTWMVATSVDAQVCQSGFVAYGLSGSRLVSFRTSTPGTFLTDQSITGVTAGETLVGIDFRPQNGSLYALGVNATVNTATLYHLSVQTGIASVVGTSGQIAFTTNGATPVDFPDPATTGYGFDFNPAADRVRVTTASGLNFRLNPNTGASVDGDNGGAAGSVAGVNPDGPVNGGTVSVDGTAYTNDAPNTSVTTLYTLDATTNALFIANPPNGGTQALGQIITLAGNPLDFSSSSGFDIPAGVNAASSNAAVVSGSGQAVLNVGGSTGLYAINLVNGQATFLGAVGNGSTAFIGFAIQNDLGGLPAIGMNSSGTSLIRFNTATPGTATTQALNLASVVAGETLVGIDFRPQTGQLYGLGIDATANTASLYLIDPQIGGVSLASAGTGSAITFAGGDFPAVSAGYGFDFNPAVDRIRVTTASGLNFRVNPNNGLPAAATPDGTINGSGIAGVSGTAYTNSYGQSLTGGVTTVYTLDGVTNSLNIQNPPNNGTQTSSLPITLGGSPLDFTDADGFDIPPSVRVRTSNVGAIGSGFAALTVGGVTSLYSINLSNGVATNFGAIAGGGTVFGGFTLAEGVATPATIGAPTSTGVTANSATLGGTVTSDGGSDIIERGVVYSKTSVNATPQIGGAGVTKVTSAGTIGAFTAAVSGLAPSTDYSFQAYATNGVACTSYTPGTFTAAPPSLTISNVTAPEGNAGVSNAVFAVTLSVASHLTVTVSVSTSDLSAVAGSDYTATGPTTLTFAPGVLVQSFSVPILGDTSLESDETFQATLNFLPSNAVIAVGTAIGTITNDDGLPPSRVFVSAGGNDANNCSVQSTPCRSILKSLGQVAIDGEIILLDTGEYEGLTIPKGVRITASAGIVALVRQSVIVNAPGGRVVLRGLTVNDSGVTLKSADALSIEETSFQNAVTGLDLVGQSPSYVSISNSTFGNLVTNGVADNSTSGNTISVVGSVFRGIANGFGISASNSKVTISNCWFLGSLVGVGLSPQSVATIRASVFAGNEFGIHLLTGASLHLSGNHIFGNDSGIYGDTPSATSNASSDGTNVIRGNQTNVNGNPLTLVPAQ